MHIKLLEKDINPIGPILVPIKKHIRCTVSSMRLAYDLSDFFFLFDVGFTGC